MKQSTKRAIGVGAGVTGAAVAVAAAAYFLSSEEGKRHRHAAKRWVTEARQEIGKKIKTAKELGKTEYGAIVDQVVKKYGSLEDVTARDVLNTARSLKAEWDRIKQHAARTAKSEGRYVAKRARTTKGSMKRSTRARRKKATS